LVPVRVHTLSLAKGDIWGEASRDVVLTKEVWERTQKIAILKQLRTHFKAKHKKGVGTLFPRVSAPLHPGSPIAKKLAPCNF